MPKGKHSNLLINETSPYLLQHAHQPVDWYPWGNQAFKKAKEKDCPIFVSIGYSSCHWCHVMAHESFDDEEIAKLLNEHFVSIKVDREERPDVDSVYMEACQAMTGSGGWPMSVFITPDKKPFYVGTYFPKDTSNGMPGFRLILTSIIEKWEQDRSSLINSADEILSVLSKHDEKQSSSISDDILKSAFKQFKSSFDKEYGGFCDAPKFPTAHNLLFLLNSAEKTKNKDKLHMAEFTLKKMYAGGMFDHIGFGFSRYSTDREYMIPHFEKMLYDNALLIIAYAKAFDTTGNQFYIDVAKKIADYILREMTSSEGGFFSAQDADSDGIEGAYYSLTPKEVCDVLGTTEGKKFNKCFGITEEGNFEGKNIPHLVGCLNDAKAMEMDLLALREYRKKRYNLHLDDKILTAWNGLMIAALCYLFRVTGEKTYLDASVRCEKFIEQNLMNEDCLYVSFRDGRHGPSGFLDDYAYIVFALINLSEISLDEHYIDLAKCLCKKAIREFEDDEKGGFYLSGTSNESLILRPKETYDGAMPSGNSVMAYNLVMLSQLYDDEFFENSAKTQLEFLYNVAKNYPMGYSFFLLSLSNYLMPPSHVTVVLSQKESIESIMKKLPLDAVVTLIKNPTNEYKLLNNNTTFYVCSGRYCLPPTNNPAILKE